MAESCPPLSCPFDASTAVETVEFAGGDGSGSERKLIHICPYRDESQIQQIIALVAPQLSEPYSIFTYRFFLSGWPQLCFLAHDGDKLVGAIVSKDEMRKCRDGSERKRGYVAMLVVDPAYRKAKIGLRLAALCMQKMVETCDEVVLETEVTNVPALALYESLGFIREKRLSKYYLNGNDAFRLKLWVK